MSYLDPVVEKARVRIIVSATAGSLVTVTRRHPSGRILPVRGMSLVPLSGGTFIGWDHEMPNGVEVTYVASVYDSSDTDTPLDVSDAATVTWTSDHEWLKDPLHPVRNIAVHISDMSEYDYTTPTAVHAVLGRPEPVTVGEVRQAATGDVTIATLDKEERDRLHYITASGNVLLLQSTQESGVGNMYLAPLGLREQRVGTRDQAERLWALSYQEVGMPAGDAAPETTWQDVINTYTTWADLIADQGTWIELLENLNSTQAPPTLAWRGA